MHTWCKISNGRQFFVVLKEKQTIFYGTEKILGHKGKQLIVKNL